MLKEILPFKFFVARLIDEVNNTCNKVVNFLSFFLILTVIITYTEQLNHINVNLIKMFILNCLTVKINVYLKPVKNF